MAKSRMGEKKRKKKKKHDRGFWREERRGRGEKIKTNRWIWRCDLLLAFFVPPPSPLLELFLFIYLFFHPFLLFLPSSLSCALFSFFLDYPWSSFLLLFLVFHFCHFFIFNSFIKGTLLIWMKKWPFSKFS